MSIQVGLNPNSRGFVSIMVNAQLQQQIILHVRRADNTLLASATFEGQGDRVHAIDIFNRREHWSFGPFNFSANLFVTIRHFRNNFWHTSRMVGPLAIRKMPEPDYPLEFHVATVISEDFGDNSHDDCTVQVLQYK